MVRARNPRAFVRFPMPDKRGCSAVSPRVLHCAVWTAMARPRPRCSRLLLRYDTQIEGQMTNLGISTGG